MTKDQLIAAIAAKTARPKVDVGLILDGLRAAVTEGLQRGETVTVAELVKLTPHEAPARTGRNPRTGLAVEIAAKKTAKAKPTGALVKALA